MKKLIIRSAVLLIIMTSLLLGYNFLYQTVRYLDTTQYLEEKFKTVPYNIQVCNFGSSHGICSYDYRNWNDRYTTFNFALSSQTLSYDYLILQQYEDHLADGGVMFITISNFSFGMDEETQLDFRSKNERYYSFMKPEYIKQYDWITAIGLKYFLPIMHDPETVISNIRESGKNGEDTYQVSGEGFDYNEDAKAAYKRHYYVDENGNLVVRKQEIDALYGMIQICKNHNIRPILITTPFREEYNEEYDEKFYNQFHNVINIVCVEEQVEYFDYSHDDRFIQSTEYLRNADHLTPKGALAFTDILMSSYVKGKVIANAYVADRFDAYRRTETPARYISTVKRDRAFSDG